MKSLLAAVVAVALYAVPVAAGDVAIAVPEPGTLTLLSSSVGAAIIGYRWFRGR